MKHSIITLFIVLMLAVFTAYNNMQVDALQAQVEGLKAQTVELRAEQEDIDSLKADMEDVKSVQGYMAWETDWRNRKVQP